MSLSISLIALYDEAIRCHPWWTILLLVLLYHIAGYVVMNPGKAVCNLTPKPPTGSARPFMFHVGQARCRATMPERKPEPEEWNCGRYDEAYTPFGGRIRRSDLAGLGRKTGYTAGSPNAGLLGHINRLSANSRPTLFPSTRVAGSPGQSTRRDLDAPRYGTSGRSPPSPRFDPSTLTPSSGSPAALPDYAGYASPGSAPSSDSSYEEFWKRLAASVEALRASVGSSSGVPQDPSLLAGNPAPTSYTVPAPAPAPRVSIPVFAPAPAPMVVDEFKPKRPRSPVLPPSPTSTYVHGPRVAIGQVIRTRLDFAEMTLSLGRRDVDMRGPGMGDMDTDLPPPSQKVPGPEPMDVDRPRRARRNSDADMAPPFVEEDVEMEPAEMMMEWDAAAAAY
ncbi:hypothetical protein FRC07_004802 [Ceratobasidium sp. 392]|nr:hypothetical protein FRC07_004802 [Ceratobasidium sp. 392]